MRIIFFTIFLLPVFLFAQTITAKYEITYGGFLNLGEAYASLSINENRYKIKIEAHTTGMAKVLTNNRVEIYESTGIYQDEIFIPKQFIKTKKDDFKQHIKTYSFDTQNKKVHIKEFKEETQSIPQTDFTKKIKHITKESSSNLDYFANNDLLSLFFNLEKLLGGFTPANNYELKAVGANKTKGKIDILIPSGKKSEELNKSLHIESKVKFIAYINQKIFSSKRGELLISLNKHNFCNKAVLKDVLLFGDISGEIVEFKIDGEKNEKI